MKASTIRIVLSITGIQKWMIRQIDLNNAFLNGFLKKEVYMTQPEGFIDPAKPHHVCKLTEALYGIK